MADNENFETISHEEELSLQRAASHRSTFKMHLGIFFLINLILWIVWFFLFKDKNDHTFLEAISFVTIIWFVFIVGHYLIVYKWNKTIVEKELSNLKKARNKQLKEIQKIREEMKNRANSTNNH